MEGSDRNHAPVLFVCADNERLRNESVHAAVQRGVSLLTDRNSSGFCGSWKNQAAFVDVQPPYEGTPEGAA